MVAGFFTHMTPESCQSCLLSSYGIGLLNPPHLPYCGLVILQSLCVCLLHPLQRLSVLPEQACRLCDGGLLLGQLPGCLRSAVKHEMVKTATALVTANSASEGDPGKETAMPLSLKHYVQCCSCFVLLSRACDSLP